MTPQRPELSRIRPRVLHLLTRMELGGAGETALALCRGLADSGYDAVLGTGVSSNSDLTGLRVARGSGVDVRVVPELTRDPSPAADLKAFAGLVNLIRSIKPEIVHTHTSKAGVLGRVAATIAGVPTIVHTVHGWNSLNGITGRTLQVNLIMERLAARLSDAIVVVSAFDRQTGLAQDIGRPQQYRLIRSGVDLKLFRAARFKRKEEAKLGLGLDPSRHVVGTVARLDPAKDPSMFAVVSQKILQADPLVQIVHVGDGPLRGEFENEIDRRGIRQGLHLLGVRRDVPEVLAAFDVFLLTSRWEGLPRVVIEACAAGVPVVATRVNGVPEVIRHGETGLLAPAGDAQALADAALQLLRDKGRASKMARRADFAVASFSVEQMVEETALLYASLFQCNLRDRRSWRSDRHDRLMRAMRRIRETPS